jgi:hypothetical protein
MTDERLFSLIAGINKYLLLSQGEKDRSAVHRLQYEIHCIQQAIATEYGRRNGLRYINSYPVKYVQSDSLVSLNDIYIKEHSILGGRSFNCQSLRERKKRKSCGVWDIDGYYMDHPYFYKDHEDRAAAIIAHSYNMPEIKPDAEKFAKEKELIISYPDFPSWYYPGWTQIIQYTPYIQENDL